MPKRTDLKKIMVIGSGPIVIGQACEFDYSGTQGIKALKEEGYEVVLVNSNPATIMTDPGLADRTYIEPIEPETVAAIVRKERPCAILPTLGGQTGLNTALALAKSGVLAECGTELIGARAEVIEKAESRELFRQAMENIGLKVPQSAIAHNMDDVRRIGSSMPFPMIIRPAFTLGGTGGGIAYNMEDLEEIAGDGLTASPVSEVMIEQSVIGWKEFEMEVMRDTADNCVIVCSIENVDAMGVHTGDSITVAPAQTLTDREYQKMRDASLAIMREIGVETGGSNVQFGVNPANGELVIIEMNPRVSRSSALASKATVTFPFLAVNGQFAHFPIVFHFRYIGIREVHGIAYLSVRAMQRGNANLPTEVRLRRAVFSPVETTCGNIAAKSFEYVVCCHSVPPLLSMVSCSGRSGNQ